MTQFSLPFTPFSSVLDAGRCNRETKKRKRDVGPTQLTSPFGHSTVTPKSNFHWDGNHRTSIRIRRYPERFVRSRPPVAPTATPGRKLRDNYYGEFAHTSPGYIATLPFFPPFQSPFSSSSWPLVVTTLLLSTRVSFITFRISWQLNSRFVKILDETRRVSEDSLPFVSPSRRSISPIQIAR